MGPRYTTALPPQSATELEGKHARREKELQETPAAYVLSAKEIDPMQTSARKSTHETHDTSNAPAPGGGAHEKPAIVFARGQKSTGERTGIRLRWRGLIGGACLVALLILFGLFHSPLSFRQRQVRFPQAEDSLAGRKAKSGMPQPTAAQKSELAMLQDTSVPFDAFSVSSSNSQLALTGNSDSSGPMIARTVSLVIQVNDVNGACATLKAILARYQGYPAELTINTPENAAPSLNASLRIPAPALESALAELGRLGRVQNESQAGEEVTQQHTDLVARLRNARETEQRLQAILQERTGKVQEVLQVEEEISKTRGEIERMEAEQKVLEHRVNFATVQLQLAEEFKAQLNGASASVGTRVRNAFVNGLGNAGDNLLAILLFLEEYGPVLLVWFAVLGAPAWLVWKRFRRAESRA
jgi:hypothetical protein